MNEITTATYSQVLDNPPRGDLCADCPAFESRVSGALTTGRVYAHCGVTGARISPATVQCNLTDEQKSTCRRAPTTSNH